MAKYRKKPVVIEAVEFTRHMASGKEPLPAGVEKVGLTHWIKKPEGWLSVVVGCWVVTDVNGMVYPCAPDIFAATYEPADSEQVTTR